MNDYLYDSIGYPWSKGEKSVFYNNGAVLQRHLYDSGHAQLLESNIDTNGGQPGSPMSS